MWQLTQGQVRQVESSYNPVAIFIEACVDPIADFCGDAPDSFKARRGFHRLIAQEDGTSCASVDFFRQLRDCTNIFGAFTRRIAKYGQSFRCSRTRPRTRISNPTSHREHACRLLTEMLNYTIDKNLSKRPQSLQMGFRIPVGSRLSTELEQAAPK